MFRKISFLLLLCLGLALVGCGEKNSGKVKFLRHGPLLGYVSFTVSSGGSATSPLNAGGIECFVGTFTFDSEIGSASITGLNLSEIGTVDATLLRKIKIFVDDGDGIWEPDQDTTQFGSTVDTFTNNRASFTGSFDVPEGATAHLHVVMNLSFQAQGNITLQIASASDLTADSATSSSFPVTLPAVSIQALPTSWQWANPPLGLDIRSQFAFGKDNIFICGTDGFLARYDGLKWHRMETNTSNDLFSVWGSAPDDVYVSGENTTLLHFDGKSWSQVNTGFTGLRFMNQIWGASEDNIYIAGTDSSFDGFIIHSTDGGQSWSKESLPANPAPGLRGIFGLSPSDIFAVGNDGTIYHYNGATWQDQSTGNSSEDFLSVWGSASDDVFAVGGAAVGIIYHYDGSSWTQQTPPTSDDLFTVFGTGANEVYAGGRLLVGSLSLGVIFRYDGSNWTLDAQSADNISSILSIEGELVAAGDKGRRYRRADSDWNALNTGVSTNIRAIHVFASDNVFAVGTGGAILHYDGTSWTQQSSGTTADLLDIWGVSPTDIVAVGASGTVLRYDGSSWTAVSGLSTTVTLRGVWATGPDNVFAVGDGGGIFHFDGSNFSAQSSGVTDNLNAIWGTLTNSSGDNEIFVAGDSGTVLNSVNNNGSGTWSSMSTGTTENLHGIHGYNEGDVYAVGAAGTVIRYNGSSWSSRNTGINASTTVRDVTVNFPNDVYAAGDGGELYRFDTNSASWVAQTSNTSGEIHALRNLEYGDFNANPIPSDGNTMFAAGNGGYVGQGPRWQSTANSTLLTRHAFPRSDRGNPLIVFSNGEAFAATTNKNHLLHFNGTEWVRYSIGIPIRGLWGNNSDNVFAVGKEGKIFHYNGTRFVPQTSGTTNDLHSVWGTSTSSEVFVVGSSGTILHTTDNGQTWNSQSNPASSTITFVDGVDANRVYAVGLSGILMHYDGASWNDRSSSSNSFYRVRALTSTVAVACGSGGTIFRTDNGGTTWSQEASGTSSTLRNIWGDSGSNIFIVGSSGTILHSTGAGSWTSQASPTSTTLRGVIGFSTGVYICGTSGTILFSNNGGSTWTQQEVGTNNTLYWIDGTSDTNAFIVGSVGQILKRE